VPNTWIRKDTLRKVLAGRSACSTSALSRIGNRRLGPYEVLQASHKQQGDLQARDFLLLRPVAGEAAASLPAAPGAAEIAAAAASSDESEAESEGPTAGAPLSTPARAPKTAPSYLSLLPAINAMLSTLPPPGPGDATPEERRALLATAMLASALPVAPQLPEADAWVLPRSNKRPIAVRTARDAVRLLRVRRVPQPHAPPAAPAAHTSALDRYTR